jgi:hypothetical protein
MAAAGRFVAEHHGYRAEPKPGEALELTCGTATAGPGLRPTMHASSKLKRELLHGNATEETERL